MLVRLDSKRRLTVPAALAPVSPGDCFEVRFDPERDTLVFRRITTNSDWLSILKECPVDMEDLPQRRRQLPIRSEL